MPRFNSSSHMWEMSMVGSKKQTKAQSMATVETYLLGRSAFVVVVIIIIIIIIRQNWTIEGDDYRCGQGKPYTTPLKLTGLS